MVIIFIAVLSGSITDTFGQLRGEADETDRKIAECCTVCGLHRNKFDKFDVDFTNHTVREHTVLDYFYFVLMIEKAKKDENDKTLHGQTTLTVHSSKSQRDILASVKKRIEINDISFWPRGKALALNAARVSQQKLDKKSRDN